VEEDTLLAKDEHALHTQEVQSKSQGEETTQLKQYASMVSTISQK